MSTNFLYDRLQANWNDLSRPFLETPDGRTLNYRDLSNLSGRYANVLSSLGVKPGDRVAVQVEKSPEALALYLACVRSGAVYLPLNTAYTPAELEYFIKDAEPSVFVARPEQGDELADVIRHTQTVHFETLGLSRDGTWAQRTSSLPEDFVDVPRGPDDLAAILYTSGTTGNAKGAMLTHRNLASNAKALMDAWRFTSDDRLIHALPIYHVHGLFVATNVVMLAGCSMVFMPKFDVDQIVAHIPGATAMMGVPTFYTRLLADPRFDKALCKDMRIFISGSAPLLAATHAEFEKRTGHAIVERYGLTETGINTSNPIDGARRAGTVGQPLEGIELRLSDPETGAVFDTNSADQNNTVGMIEVRGPNVFSGYWRMPDKTAAEFRPDGFFVTGDLGRIDDEGYVHIVGRSKDLIISGGLNVYPKEIESRIDQLPAVDESAVIGLPHTDLGEAVTAIVVLRSNIDILPVMDEQSIIAALTGELASFKRPKRVLFVDELPRNAMGKVQKNLLRRKYRELYEHA